MKNSLLAILLLVSVNSSSQNFFTSVFAGGSNYNGDIQDKMFTLIRSKPAWGLGLMFELNDRMLIRGDFSSAQIHADDKFSKLNKARNLSFYSDITEFSLGFEYTLFNLYDYKVSPYLFTGVGVFKFSPYIKAANGSKIILSELDTEGQGFYLGRSKYKLRQLCIPFGGGIQWALTDNKRIGFVIGIRKTFTDYLDDVSTTYVDKDLLIQKRGVKAATLAYRGNELPNGDPYPVAGTKRGNPANQDWYYFTGITARFRIGLTPKKRLQSYKVKKAKVSCPKPF